MEETKIIIEDNGFLKINIYKQFYEREAIFSAAKKFTNNNTIIIRPSTDKRYVEILFQANEDNKLELEDLAKKFCNELLDQQVRLDLEKRFWKIRELIVQHAFSPIANLQEESQKCK